MISTLSPGKIVKLRVPRKETRGGVDVFGLDDGGKCKLGSVSIFQRVFPASALMVVRNFAGFSATKNAF